MFGGLQGVDIVGAYGGAPLSTLDRRLQGAQPCVPTAHAPFALRHGARSAPLRDRCFV